MNDESLMPYGKFKGDKLENVPAYYLLWMYDNGKLNNELKAYVDENRTLLEKDI